MAVSSDPIPISTDALSFAVVDFVRSQSLVRGDDWAVSFVWSQGGVPVDLTGWSGQVRLYAPGGAAPFYTGPLALGSDGSIVGSVPAATTPTFPRGEALYFCTLTDPTGHVRTRVTGTLRGL